MLPDEIPQNLQDKYTNNFPFPVIGLARDLGLEIYETNDFDDSQSGSIVKEGDKYIIYVNSRQPATRKRFSIAHEIGHFLKHRNKLDSGTELVDYVAQSIPNGENKTALYRKSNPNISDEGKKCEQEANLFAAEILMPEDKFREVFEKNNTIEQVAEYFNVSQSAATIRAKTLFNIFLT